MTLKQKWGVLKRWWESGLLRRYEEAKLEDEFFVSFSAGIKTYYEIMRLWLIIYIGLYFRYSFEVRPLVYWKLLKKLIAFSQDVQLWGRCCREAKYYKPELRLGLALQSKSSTKSQNQERNLRKVQRWCYIDFKGPSDREAEIPIYNKLANREQTNTHVTLGQKLRPAQTKHPYPPLIHAQVQNERACIQKTKVITGEIIFNILSSEKYGIQSGAGGWY